MKTAWALVGALACTVAALSSTGCGGTSAKVAVENRAAEPHWQDVFETTPELLVVLRPTALAQDKVYGPLLHRVLDAARDRSRLVASTRILEVVQGADQVVVGIRPSARGGDDPAELVVVVRGVPASTNPAKVVDADGRPLWSAGPAGPVRELVRERDDHGHPLDASLSSSKG